MHTTLDCPGVRSNHDDIEGTTQIVVEMGECILELVLLIA